MQSTAWLRGPLAGQWDHLHEKGEGNEIPLQTPILTFQNRGVGGLHVPLAVVSTTLPWSFPEKASGASIPSLLTAGPWDMTGWPERSLALEEKDLER